MSTTVTSVHDNTSKDFSFITNKFDRDFYEDAYKAISKTDGGWDFLKNQSPPEGKGFIFWNHPMINNITNNMEMADSHSGASFACIMRAMEFVAKNGWDKWVKLFDEQYKKYA